MIFTKYIIQFRETKDGIRNHYRVQMSEDRPWEKWTGSSWSFHAPTSRELEAFEQMMRDKLATRSRG